MDDNNIDNDNDDYDDNDNYSKHNYENVMEREGKLGMYNNKNDYD